ncbi:MAG: hypothetical protein PHQ93_06195 [Sulfurimonas sp.]|uniref:hypothetical protein n=1 Tax=Sulfurimonas sp. TaxID=2022749 RepID=UPI00260FE266|nr:hypothetical protein [Sulfurimonas sp.]MDD5400756.1 hypothetical protein [Sulfurimonas sp.]
MPRYKVQLKQGSRTIVEHIECSNVENVLAFYQSVSTMKITEILKVEYELPASAVIPPDDFQYRSIYKGLIKDTATNKSRQIILHNIKLSVSENDIVPLIRTHMKIDGASVDSIYCSLFKR